MITRRLLLSAAAVTATFGPGFAQAQTWPQRAVRFVNAAAPGGSLDLIGRPLAEQLTTMWGQPVVVENRGGGGGRVAAQLMARATPDGYAALFATASFAINLSLSRDPGYSAEQFLPTAVIAGTPNLFVVRADSRFRTLGEIVEAARRRPLSYGSGGIGTAPHLVAELLFKRAGARDMTHVPYPGAGPAMMALLAGDIDMLTISLPTAVPHIRDARARGFAVTSDRRSEALPDVPTVAEAGFEPIVDSTWVAMFFPAGTPQAVLERVNADVQRAMERPAYKQRLAAIGFEPIGGDLAVTKAFMATEIAKWSDIIRTVNVQID